MPTWALWVFGIALAILFIWLWNTANSAKATAERNAALLARPELEVAYLVGGPTRFEERFDEAVEDAELESFDSADYLWSTALVSNDGIDEIDASLAAELQPELEPTILVSLPGFGDHEVSREGEATVIDLNELDEGESALVFFGFDRENLPEGYATDWAGNFQGTLDRLTAESGDVDETLYGRSL
jgi:hypothetical protein